MIPLVKKWWMALWFDANSAEKILRSTALFVGGMAVCVLAFPYPVVKEWTFMEWVYRIAASGALGFAGTIAAGQKNPTADQIRVVAAEPVGTPPPPGMS